MAPTLIDLDGLAHQTKQASQAGSGFVGSYDAVSDVGSAFTFDSNQKRLPQHVCSLKMVMDASNAATLNRTLPASTRHVVGSIYFRAVTAPASSSIIQGFSGPTGATNVKLLSNGTVQASIGGTNGVASLGSYIDGKWHLLDYHVDTSANPIVLNAKVDGVAIGQASNAQAAVDCTTAKMGDSSAGDNLACWLSDWVLSVTSTDYPIGHHAVIPVYLSADGTHALGTTNKIQGDAGETTNLIAKINDWATGTPDTSAYITYASTTLGDAASNFAEFTLATVPSRYVIWDVKAYLAGFANGTSADNADLQVLDGHGGTLIDHVGNLIDYSGSASVLGYHQKTLARIAGGWTPANLSSCVVQWGRSTDTNAIPRLSAVMFEIAVQALPLERGTYPLA